MYQWGRSVTKVYESALGNTSNILKEKIWNKNHSHFIFNNVNPILKYPSKVYLHDIGGHLWDTSLILKVVWTLENSTESKSTLH